MIAFDAITKLFSLDLNNKFCIEIEFRVIGFPSFQNCWMGKMPHQSNKNNEVYWFGLSNDGSKAYDFDNYLEFSTAQVFDGKSLKEVWDSVEVLSIDGSDPQQRINSMINQI